MIRIESALPLEELDRSFVLFRRSQGFERTQIPPLAGLRVLLP